MQPSDFRGIATEAKKADFWLKDVSGDLQMAGSILTKSLIALDRLAQVVGKPVVEREVALLNGALAMLGNANHHTKLARRFIMTREIHKKYSHLCLDKLPMTRFLFGDDVSQSARKIEGTDRLWNNFSTKAAPVAWKFTGGRSRPFWGRSTCRGFADRFQPYKAQCQDYRSGQWNSSTRLESNSKNARGRGLPRPRQ